MSEIEKQQSQDIIEARIAEFRLSKEEAIAYRYYCQTNTPPLAPDLQEKMFRVFLAGSSCEEIFKLNGKKYPLGSIVSARIEGNWDGLIKKYASDMIEATANKVAMANAEAISLISSLIIAETQVNLAKVLKYNQTQDPDDLGSIRIEGLKGFKEAVELLNKLNSKDGQPGSVPQVLIQAETVQTAPAQKTESQSVSDLLKKLQGKR